uniref:RNA 3'-terminal phosphate cyclase n=1 Tax=Schistocephalus solidus TaxID=70667 RepID=A0A0X3P5J3_SCHSO
MTDPNFEHVIIDGSLLEGVRIVYFLLSFTKGGQILRNAVSLCVLAKKAVTIEKIRAGRPKPGLSPQHLTGLELAALISDAQLQGCIANSQQITFKPKCIKTGEFEGDAKTAGSVALLAQITVPILAFGQRASTLVLKGGTDASFAPPIDYLSEVTAHYYRKMGLYFDIEVLERGYYPQGGGTVKVVVQPVTSKLSPITLHEIGSISRVLGSSFVAGKVPIKVAEQMSAVAKRLLRNYLPECPININTFRAPDNRFRACHIKYFRRLSYWMCHLLYYTRVTSEA